MFSPPSPPRCASHVPSPLTPEVCIQQGHERTEPIYVMHFQRVSCGNPRYQGVILCWKPGKEGCRWNYWLLSMRCMKVNRILTVDKIWIMRAQTHICMQPNMSIYTPPYLLWRETCVRVLMQIQLIGFICTPAKPFLQCSLFETVYLILRTPTQKWVHISLTRPHPAFHRLSVRKSKESLVSFLMWVWRNRQMTKNSEQKAKFQTLLNQVQIQRLVHITVTPR